jgi:hypothetical protein
VCAADYRLTGDTVDRICALHFHAKYRVLVCFPEEEHVVVVLIAEHDRGSKDVYGALYELLGISQPKGKRSKPSWPVPCRSEGRSRRRGGPRPGRSSRPPRGLLST